MTNKVFKSFEKKELRGEKGEISSSRRWREEFLTSAVVADCVLYS
jgi:hypothetical protein